MASELRQTTYRETAAVAEEPAVYTETTGQTFEEALSGQEN